jgi:hypothetical protein
MPIREREGCQNQAMKTIHNGLLFAVIFTIPLQQLLYISLGGITLKTYQVLLILLALVSLMQVRKGEPLWQWQKIGLLFFLTSVCGEAAGYIELLNFGNLPEVKGVGISSVAIVLNFYLLLNMIFAFQIARYIKEQQNNLTDILTVAALSSIIPALYAIYQLTSFIFNFEISFLEFDRIIDRPDAPRGIFIDRSSIRVSSTYFEPGPYGGYLSIIIPLLVGLLVWRHQTKSITVWQRAGFTGLLLLNIVALFLSFSTSAIIGMIFFTVLVLYYTQPFSKILKIMASVAAVVVCVVTLFELWEFVLTVADSLLFKKLFADESDELSISRLDRIYQAEIALKMFLSHPIIGIGPYIPFFFEMYVPNSNTVNPQAVSIIYANVPVQTGIVGFIIFVYCLYKLFLGLKYGISAAGNTPMKDYGAVLMGLFVSILILFFTLGSIVAAHLWLALGVMIGFIESFQESSQSSRLKPQTSEFL